MSSWFKNGLTVLLSVGLISCDKKEKEVVVQTDGYQDLYLEQLAKTNATIGEYNALLSANQDTTSELWATQLLVAIVDKNASIYMNEITVVEANLLKGTLIGKACDVSEARSGLNTVDARAKDAIEAIQNLETQMSKTNLDRLVKNVALNIKPEFRAAKIADYRNTTNDALKQFGGLRQLFLSSAYSVKNRVNQACGSEVSKFEVEDYAPEVVVPVAEASGKAEGKVFAQNGTDPVVEALVYVPVAGNEWIKNSGMGSKLPATQGALSCGEPQEAYITKTCSNGSGAFRLEGLPTGTVIIKMSKGLYSKRFAVVVTNGQTTSISQGETTLPKAAAENAEIANIAVIEGQYDKLEKVLEKIGLKNVDGTKNYSVHTSAQGVALINNAEELAKVDMLMINCGTSDLENQILGNEASRSNLKKWVEAGGRLFVTDQAYDFVEQVFPSAIEFDGDWFGKGEQNRAQTGPQGVTFEADITKIGLQTWLEDGVKCLTSQSCLLPSKKVKIDGFASGWAKMSGADAKTNVWVKNTERPLTVTFDAGQGRVFYSSYHTNHGSGSEITPQERILQYFVFDLVD